MADSTDPVLDALWQRVLAAWEEDKAHGALLDHALHTESLPEIARRYRALVDDPQKGRGAKKKVDAIVVAATHLLLSTRTPRPVRVPLPITLSAFGLSVAMLGWLAWAVWGVH
ncbi:MAG: hypothetical protein ABSF69_03425 [Polyangiaceae bacterium]|jgi:hypothetical protein